MENRTRCGRVARHTWHAGFMALLLALLPVIAVAAEVTGVAFVHGTGHQRDARQDYWQPAIIDAVSQGLADRRNQLVVNCDFEHYMWAPGAAGCLAEQLAGFIETRGITRLVLVTHSNGGNVVRWILSNPTYDSRYPKILDRVEQVIALAPSSAGTPLADAVINGNMFAVLVGWLLGYANDAVRQQQVGQMALHNAQNLYGTAGRPQLPVPFRVVVGSDVRSAFWDSGSYCGGYEQSLGLAVTQLWLSSCSDGFLDCSSQRAAGTPWFTDTERTEGARPLNHNQSRRECFGLGALLGGQLR